MDRIKDYVRLVRSAKRQLYYVTGVKMYNRALELINEYMQSIGVDGICITKPKSRCPEWTEE